MSCRVEASIRATPEIVWAILTDAKNFPRWNSTVTAIEGEIRDGGRLRVHVPGTDRTFAPKVTDVAPPERMTWTGGFAPLFKGVRTFTLRRGNEGSTRFAMEERFSGLMLPLVKNSLPDFGNAGGAGMQIDIRFSKIKGAETLLRGVSITRRQWGSG